MVTGRVYMSECRNWYNGDPILEEYHDHEWCKISHDDDFQFQMLCLEGASVGLSWQIIMHKRAAYLTAFHGFIIDECAAMTDEELEALRSDPGIIRNKNKIYSVRKNAQIVKKIQKEFGSFDAYLWSFTDGRQIDGGLCQRCRERLGFIVHHRIELTPANIGEPDVALNQQLLEYLCLECHNKEHGVFQPAERSVIFDENGDVVAAIDR